MIMILAFLACLPGLLNGILGYHTTPALGVFMFGIAIFAGAIVLP
jgi:hypothetical protein